MFVCFGLRLFIGAASVQARERAFEEKYKRRVNAARRIFVFLLLPGRLFVCSQRWPTAKFALSRSGEKYVAGRPGGRSSFFGGEEKRARGATKRALKRLPPRSAGTKLRSPLLFGCI